MEGGVRGAAVVWHSGMKPTEELHTDYVHITDWIPTLYEAGGEILKPRLIVQPLTEVCVFPNPQFS